MATIRTVDGHNYRIDGDPPQDAAGYVRTVDGWLVRATAIAAYMPDPPAHQSAPAEVDSRKLSHRGRG